MGRRNIGAERIIARDGFGCHYCGKPMNVYFGELTPAQSRDPMRFTLEHVVPRSHGGTFGMYNIVGRERASNTKTHSLP